MRNERRYGMGLKVIRHKYWEGYMAGTCITFGCILFVMWVMG